MEQIPPLYFGAQQVREVLTWPLVNEAVEEAMKAVSGKQAATVASYARQPPRVLTVCDDQAAKLLFTMPGFVGNYQLTTNANKQQHDTLACKLVTSFTANANRQPPLPSVLANILLFDTATGQLQCILDGTQITAWRTAAASIVATKHLYFRRGGKNKQTPINVAIIGCGVQGQSHAAGMCATFDVANIYLWNRTVDKAEALATQLRATVAPTTQVHVTQCAAEAVATADVICVGTYAAQALIDASMLQKEQVHINAVGAGKVHFGEVAQDIYDRAEVYVDNWASAKMELKDLKARIIAEVGEVINGGKHPAAEAGITIFQSMGMAAEDATVAQAVYEALKANKT